MVAGARRRNQKKEPEELTELDRLLLENKKLQAEKEQLEMEVAVQKKVAGNSRKVQSLALTRKGDKSLVVQELHDECGWPISRLCVLVEGYYKWLKRVPTKRKKKQVA